MHSTARKQEVCDSHRSRRGLRKRSRCRPTKLAKHRQGNRNGSARTAGRGVRAPGTAKRADAEGLLPPPSNPSPPPSCLHRYRSVSGCCCHEAPNGCHRGLVQPRRSPQPRRSSLHARHLRASRRSSGFKCTLDKVHKDKQLAQLQGCLWAGEATKLRPPGCCWHHVLPSSRVESRRRKGSAMGQRMIFTRRLACRRARHSR